MVHFQSSLGVYGAERWTFTLMTNLNRERVDPVMMTIGAKPGAAAFYEFVVKQGVPAEHLGVPGQLHPQAILQLRRYLVTHCIDVLHTHGFKSDIIGALAAWGLPVRLVSTLHGWSADEGWLIRAYEAIGRLFLRRFDRLYPLSPALLRTLQRLNFPASKLRLVLNAVDETAFEASWQQRQTRQAHEPLTILFVGRLCRPKGIFDLLHAFHRSRFDVPALLQVVGEGPERAEIEALCERLDIASRVRFVGFVDDVRPLYDSSDVLVLPSYSEGIPRVVMEAFAAGLPVIGTAIPGIQQLVTHEGTGLLAPLGDEAGLAQALERMAAAPEWARDMALQARHLIETTHAASRQAQEFEAEYIELAREVRATR